MSKPRLSILIWVRKENGDFSTSFTRHLCTYYNNEVIPALRKPIIQLGNRSNRRQQMQKWGGALTKKSKEKRTGQRLQKWPEGQAEVLGIFWLLCYFVHRENLLHFNEGRSTDQGGHSKESSMKAKKALHQLLSWDQTASVMRRKERGTWFHTSSEDPRSHTKKGKKKRTT